MLLLVHINNILPKNVDYFQWWHGQMVIDFDGLLLEHPKLLSWTERSYNLNNKCLGLSLDLVSTNTLHRSYSNCTGFQLKFELTTRSVLLCSNAFMTLLLLICLICWSLISQLGLWGLLVGTCFRSHGPGFVPLVTEHLQPLLRGCGTICLQSWDRLSHWNILNLLIKHTFFLNALYIECIIYESIIMYYSLQW